MNYTIYKNYVKVSKTMIKYFEKERLYDKTRHRYFIVWVQ